MVDISHVDLVALIERKAGIRIVGKPVRVHGVREVHSNCPWCPGSEDSFIIKVDEGWFSHAVRNRGCGRSGDAITFLYEWEGTEFLDACEELGVTLDGSLPNDLLITRKAYKPEYPPQCKKWKDAADSKLSRAQGLIHTGIGLEYARKRGFTDGTILDWRLGYVPFRDDQQHFFTIQPDEWGLPKETGGKKLYMYEGLLIPWLVKGKVWKLQVRRISGTIDPKYKILPIKGSVEHCLFNQDALRDDKPVVLVESALCAISGNQEAGDVVTFIPTGGARQNQYEHNVSLLASAPVVLIAFDNDENKAGDNGAQYWKESLPHALRWHPWGHDINDMLVSGMNIRAWVEIGLVSAELEQQTEGQPSRVQDQPPSSLLVSSTNSDTLPRETPNSLPIGPDHITDDAYLDENLEQALCYTCLEEDIEKMTPAIGEFEGMMYCAEHMPTQHQTEKSTACTDPEDNPVIAAVMKVFSARLIEVIPVVEWEQRKAEILQQDRRQDHQQGVARDYWTTLEAKLADKGYHKAFADTSQRLLSRIDLPRRYPCPVPHYELREDEMGIKHLQVVGMWQSSSESYEGENHNGK